MTIGMTQLQLAWRCDEDGVITWRRSRDIAMTISRWAIYDRMVVQWRWLDLPVKIPWWCDDSVTIAWCCGKDDAITRWRSRDDECTITQWYRLSVRWLSRDVRWPNYNSAMTHWRLGDDPMTITWWRDDPMTITWLCEDEIATAQYGRFELQIVRTDLHLVTYLNHCSRSGQLFCPGKWWRRNNGEQLASARTHACALTGQWFESSVLRYDPMTIARWCNDNIYLWCSGDCVVVRRRLRDDTVTIAWWYDGPTTITSWCDFYILGIQICF